MLSAISSGWSFEAWAVVALLIPTIAYSISLAALRRQGIVWRVIDLKRILAFYCGIFSLVVALMSPLDELSEHLFSAHMTQHLMLMLVAPPLILLGRPEAVMLWTFSLNGRRVVGNIWKKSGALRKYSSRLGDPVCVWLLATFVMWFWHIPGPYSWAFNHPVVHILEHLSFFATSLALWWYCLKPFNREGGGHGTALILVFTFMFQSALLGALLTFAGHPIYKEHAVNNFSQLSPLADQQLAGLIMWIPAGAVQLLVLSLLFHHWLSSRDGFNHGFRQALKSTA